MSTPDSPSTLSNPISEEDIAELVELYLEQTRTGQCKLSLEEFAAAHPRAEQELLEILSAVCAVEKLGRSNAHTTHANIQPSHFPKELGGYTLIEKIGRGGMGTVYRARQESLQREVAIKILAPSWNDDEEHCAAFENEARLIAQLRHTNIVEVYGAGHEQGYRYYVMGLVRGKVLSPQGIRQTFPPLSYEQALTQVGIQAAKALCFAHQHGILHRDIKPGNLMLDNEGTLHVTDFGIATVLNEGEVAPLVTQSNDGTLRYMAPERLLHGKSSYATDQYALGLTLYELLENKPAFQESEPGSLIRRICETPLAPLQKRGDLGAIINKAISFDPKDRYPSMQEMLEDLMRYQNGEPIHAKRIGLLRRYKLWMKRKTAIAIWLHLSLLLVIALFFTGVIAYARILTAWKQAEEQSERAQRNATIASNAISRIINSLSVSEQDAVENDEIHLPSKADVRLMQALLPYYAELLNQGAVNDSHMGEAAHAIAMIAIRSGDYEDAERQLILAMQYYQNDQTELIRLRNRLSFAYFLQRKPQKRRLAILELKKNLSLPRENLSFATRIELFYSLQLALRLNRAMLRNKNAEFRKNTIELDSLLTDYANYLAEMRKEQPDNAQLQLIHANLIHELRDHPRYNKLFTPHGETTHELLDKLLESNPDYLTAKRSYTRYATRYRGVNLRGNNKRNPQKNTDKNPFSLEKAALYAQEILAASPNDTLSILQYLTARLLYVNEIERNGDDFAAELAHERTLGVLELLLSRSDIAPETRERLLYLLSDRPEDQDIQAQAKEWQSLMNSHDAKRLRNLRKRMENIRRKKRRPHPPHNPRWRR